VQEKRISESQWTHLRSLLRPLGSLVDMVAPNSCNILIRFHSRMVRATNQNLLMGVRASLDGWGRRAKSAPEGLGKSALGFGVYSTRSVALDGVRNLLKRRYR
jgi:hypothetical protein